MSYLPSNSVPNGALGRWLLVFWLASLLLALPLSRAWAQAAAQPEPELSDSALELYPELIFLLNYSPSVFGFPGTRGGDLKCRTQLSGDWAGNRCELVRNGVMIDAYSTTGYQDVTSGGLREIDALAQSTDLAVNLDTGRLGWWSRGLIRTTVSSRYGGSLGRSLAAGSALPVNAAYLFPVVDQTRSTYPSEYYIGQALNDEHIIAFGKVNALWVSDHNVLAGNYRYQFQNVAFNVNPILGEFFHPVAWLGAHVWTPRKRFRVFTAVADPTSSASNFADDLFEEVSIYQQFDYAYSLGRLPGMLRGTWVYTTKPATMPAGPESVETFVSPRTPVEGSSPRVSGSFAVLCNAEQYLRVIGDASEIGQRRKLGLQLRGYGLFARFGTGPSHYNFIDLFASLGVSGYGISKRRPDDRFGLGWYCVHFSNELESGMIRLAQSHGLSPGPLHSEQGVEAFYSFAITPAVYVTPSFQYIWNPLAASLAGRDHAALWNLRLEMAL